MNLQEDAREAASARARNELISCYTTGGSLRRKGRSKKDEGLTVVRLAFRRLRYRRLSFMVENGVRDVISSACCRIASWKSVAMYVSRCEKTRVLLAWSECALWRWNVLSCRCC